MDKNSDELEKQKVEQTTPSYVIAFGVLLVLLFSIPIITGYITYLNKIDGLIYGSIGTIISIIIMKITEPSSFTYDISYFYSSILVLVIIITSIIFIIRH